MVEKESVPRPIIIVTGANGGVGYGICQRLLIQLCQTNPPDSLPQAFASGLETNEGTSPPLPPVVRYNGLTLIMACRNMKRANAAKTSLLQWFDVELERMAIRERDNERARSFREGCDIQIAELDLANFGSVLRFAENMKKFPYISHVVFNAGIISFHSINWLPCLKQFLTSPMAAVTSPVYYLQHSGEMSTDNLGWVWQSNVFGHFALFRELEPLLSKTPFEAARVIWSSSLEASPTYDPEDWQLIKTSHSYESSKYQVDLIATYLDRLACASTTTTAQKPIRHFVSEPGICSTMISQALTGPSLDIVKVIIMYIARFFGSPYHTIIPLKAAIAAIHLILVPFAFILNDDLERPVRYGARTDWWGQEYVDTSSVKGWALHQAESAQLVKKCDTLYLEMKKAEIISIDSA